MYAIRSGIFWIIQRFCESWIVVWANCVFIPLASFQCSWSCAWTANGATLRRSHNCFLKLSRRFPCGCEQFYSCNHSYKVKKGHSKEPTVFSWTSNSFKSSPSQGRSHWGGRGGTCPPNNCGNCYKKPIKTAKITKIPTLCPPNIQVPPQKFFRCYAPVCHKWIS